MSDYRIQRHRYGDDLDMWWKRVVVIWHEDETRTLDREKMSEAFERIFGNYAHFKRALPEYDGGDMFMRVDSAGRVMGQSCEGDFIGVVAKVVRDE